MKMTVANESTKKVLSALFSRKMLSRKDIAQATGLSRAAVTYSVDELLRQGILLEKGVSEASPKGGPKPVNLCLNSEACLVISILVRPGDPIVQIVDITGEVRCKYPFLKQYYEDFSQMIDETVGLCRRAIEEFGRARFLGVGISVPGNIRNNEVVFSPYFDAKKLNLGKKFSQELGMDVFVERDVYNMAYGERWRGCAQKQTDFLCVWISSGIGSAAIVDSKLINGAMGLAGEMGFMAVDKRAYRERPYTLDDFGYFEEITSVRRLEEKYCAPFEQVIALAERNAAIMQDLYAMCDTLAMGITNAILLLNPSVIIVSGRFRHAKAAIGAYFEHQVHQLCPMPCDIRFSYLGEDAITLGGTYLVLNQRLGIEMKE